MTSFTISKHAHHRMNERNIQSSDLDFFCRYGKSMRIQGYCGWYLPKDVSWAPRRLLQLVVITTEDGHVVTSYWSKGSPKQLVQKMLDRHRRPSIRS